MMNSPKRCFVVLAILSACCLRVWCAPVLGDVALHQALLDIGTDLRLMCVAAHPDDEDGATLAHYRMKYGIHTVALFATRGEGGQNEIGPELYNELGVIRTRETMAATRIQDAELRYLNLPEFGFSKSPDEAFQVWGKEETIRRMVRAIREERPDVIISHHGTLKDHGHHQAVGIALQEAFDAAADPAKFPEQIAAGLRPWQASRLYLRDWANTPGAQSVLVDIGELEPARGITYAEVAAQALEEHRSQGMAMFAETRLSGRPKTYYTLVKEAPQREAVTSTPAPNGALFAGLHDRVSAKDGALSHIDSAAPDLPARLLKLTAAALKQRAQSPDALRRWEKFNRAAAAANGLALTARAEAPECVPGQTITVNVALSDFGAPNAKSAEVSLKPYSWFSAASPDTKTVQVTTDADAVAALTVKIPADQALTVPAADHLFEAHFLEPQLMVTATVACGATPIELSAPVRVDIAPPISADFVEPKYLARAGVDKTVRFDVRLTNHAPNAIKGDLVVSLGSSLIVKSHNFPVEFATHGDQRIVPVVATFGANTPTGDHYITAMIDGMPRATHAIVRVVDLKVPDKARVGVIQSYDDVFMKTLDRLQVPHEALELKDLTPERLATFTSIIVDIRAYRARPDLVANNQAVLDFVKHGGALLVMYQKTFDWKETYAPYPIHVSTNRVTREDAPIQLLAPDHPLFKAPNAIMDSDWAGWIQERGLYFPDSWDKQYTPLIACADPGENIPPGSCLIAKYGDGTYFYTALGWYRQLRELHPGALRVFANMIALGTPHN